MSHPTLDMTVTYLPSADGHTVRVECPATGETSAPLSAGAIRLAASFGQALNKGVLGTDGPAWTEADAKRVGQELFDTVLPGAAGYAVRDGIEKAHSRRGVVRLRVRFDAADKYLHEVPWELLYDATADGFLALHPTVLLSRYPMQPKAVTPVPVSGPVRVAALAASPKELEPLDVEGDVRGLQAGFAGPDATVAPRLRCRWADATALPSGGPVHVLHLAMHGRVHDGRYQLAFEAADGSPHWVSAAELVPVIDDLRDLRLVVLNACQSAEKFGLAATLAGLNVPAVIGLRTNIRDRVANRFAAALYDVLPSRPIDQAVREARNRLRGADSTGLGWLLPVLYLRTSDPVIVAAGSGYREVSTFGEPQFPAAHPQPPARPAPAVSPPPAPPPAPVGGMRLNFGSAVIDTLKVFGTLQGAGGSAPPPPAPPVDMQIEAANARIRSATVVQSAYLTQGEIAAFFGGMDGLR